MSNGKPKKASSKAKADLAKNPAITGELQVDGRVRTQFKPGVSGNPAGRPAGSRNKFCKAMLDDFANTWREGGKEALQKMMANKPNEFVRASLQWVPQEFDVGDKTQGAFRQLWEALATGKIPSQPLGETDGD